MYSILKRVQYKGCGIKMMVLVQKELGFDNRGLRTSSPWFH
ncbi:MAG: hypothetical protein ACI9YP_001631, partial [Colwellia sp.]